DRRPNARSLPTRRSSDLRELNEETGLEPRHVEVLGTTPGWLRYRLPERAIRRHEKLVCIGQKQVWFLLRLTGRESDVRLDVTSRSEEHTSELQSRENLVC